MVGIIQLSSNLVSKMNLKCIRLGS